MKTNKYSKVNNFQECPIGKHGDGCKYNCGKCTNLRDCHFLTGACSNGCEPGYLGEYCTKGNYEKKHYHNLS